VGIILIT